LGNLFRDGGRAQLNANRLATNQGNIFNGDPETESVLSIWSEEFGIRRSRASETWRELLDGLIQLAAQDYRNLPSLPSRLTIRSAQRLIRKQTIPHPGLFGPQLYRSTFQCSSDHFCNDRLVVVGYPYVSGAGRRMWGFSADLRDTSRGEFVIYLNTAHVPGAIETTLIHEVGHYLFRLMNGSSSKQHNPMLSTFAAHMNQPSELFCDSLVSLLAFSQCRKERYAGLNGAPINLVFRRVRELHRTIAPKCFIDLSDSAIFSSWRLIYLSSLVHLCKLRSALLDVAGA
jgi:hypothetical protein